MMKVAALFTGGKDSVFAVYIAQQYGWDITHLVTIRPKIEDSWMYHSINIHLADLLAQALDIPLVSKETEGVKEQEVDDLKAILKTLDIDGVISGAIASEYQRTRIEKICDDLDMYSFTPLWHKDQELLLRDQIRAGFDIVIVGVYAQGLDQTWLGQSINKETIDDLIILTRTYDINAAGEGGEFETLVIDGPIFRKKLVLDKISKEWKRDSGVLLVHTAHLE